MTGKRTKQPKYVAPSLPILKLADVPGPEADADVLNAHYRLVQNALATHRYDDVIQSCHWCLDMEAGLAYSKTDEARGTRLFCSGRCANAYSAYQVKVLNYGQRVAPAPIPDEGDDPTDEGDEPASDPDETPEPEPTSEPELDPAEATKAGWARQVSATGRGRRRRVKDVTTVTGKEGTGKTTARQPRAKKPERTDGKCTKGLHEMTEANTYSYNGGTWCRECRKASRTKSKNGGSK
jgi:hypothetical protein